MSTDARIDARAVVERTLAEAVARRASDVHFEPTAGGYEVRFRIDGLLEPAARHDAAAGRSLVTRLMVLAGLLTYRLDVPQEGRLPFTPPAPTPARPPGDASVPSPAAARALELRLAVMPTTHGLRCAVRMPADLLQPQSLDDLALPPAALAGIKRFAAADAGLLVVTGPAGSGKTTTLYALLQHVAAASPGLSLISLEDPVERDVPGVTQIEVSPFGQLTYERALRSILRQDPQVLMLGEIRDAATASLALQAALSGHRLVCTLHAGHPGGAVARLLEMGPEPYQLTSALFGIVAQRLLRKTPAGPAAHDVPRYRGRAPAAEFAAADEALRKAILARADAEALRRLIEARPGYVTMRAAAEALVAEGVTDAAEVRRVLGDEPAP